MFSFDYSTGPTFGDEHMQTNGQLACRPGAIAAGLVRIHNLQDGHGGFVQSYLSRTSADDSQVVSELDDINSLVQLYRPRLLRYVVFSIGDLDLAESITQDCFLKAFNGRHTFRGDCSVNTWLFGIANNLIRDQLRTKKFQFWRRARATAVDITDIASVIPGGERSPEDQILIRERTNQVQQALRDLSPNQRRAFILRFLEDMDFEEISVVMDMPTNTVKSHLYRAVTAIRTHLGEKKMRTPPLNNEQFAAPDL